MSDRFGDKQAYDLSEIMNHRAPLTLRVNPLKTSRDSVISIDDVVHETMEKSLSHSNRILSLRNQSHSKKPVQCSGNGRIQEWEVLDPG
jgi:16S rRNA C967 or C1407 C5-methylase (RsmB/RsmF family)